MEKYDKQRLDRILSLSEFNWENPEEIYDKWLREDHRIVGKFINELYDSEDDKKLRTLYFNYEFFENQLLTFLESDTFAYEKTHWILKQYFERLVGGIPDSIPEFRKTYHPEFGDTSDWINFVETVDNIYHNGLTATNMRNVTRMHKLYEEYLNYR